MVRRLIVVALVGPASLWFSPAAQAQCCGGKDTGCGAHGSHAGDSAEATDGPQGGAGGTFLAAAPAEKAGEKTGGKKKVETSFLLAYFRVWKALGKDELKGVPEAKKDLVSALQASAKTAPKGLAEKDRVQRGKLLASAQAAASKLDVADLKKAREGFGALSGDLRKFVEGFPAEADAFVVYCDMAKKSWLQDTPKVLNPYYGASMSDCGSVVHKPGKGSTKAGEGAGEEKPADPHAGHGGHQH